MKFLYKRINGVIECEATHTTEIKAKLLGGWVAKPHLIKSEVKKEKSMKEQAIELGLPVEKDGKDIHHKTLGKMIEAKQNEHNES